MTSRRIKNGYYVIKIPKRFLGAFTVAAWLYLLTFLPNALLDYVVGNSCFGWFDNGHPCYEPEVWMHVAAIFSSWICAFAFYRKMKQ